MSATVLATAAILTTSSMVKAAVTTIVVSGDTAAAENSPGWLFNRDTSTATPFTFTTDQHSLGQGSLYVQPIGTNAADKFIGENFVNTPITDVTSISYDFMIGPHGASTQEEQFYMSVYANFGISDDLKYYDCRYSVVPTVGSKDGFTTVTFDPNQAYPVTTRGGASASPYTCPAVPAAMNLLSPGSNIRMFALNVGDTSTSDTGLDGYFDKVVVSTTAGTTISDFEPVLTPEDKDECKKNGWKGFNHPYFKNQGECVSHVESHRHGHNKHESHRNERGRRD